MAVSRLTCTMCREPYLEEEVRLDLALAFCKRCNTVRDLPANASALVSGDEGALAPAPRAKETLPAGFQVEERPGALRISWKLPAGGPVAGLLFWVGCGVMVVVRGNRGLVQPHLLVLFGLVALGLAYMLVAALVNRTVAEVSADTLRVTHGPLPVPWRIARAIAAADIEQLACRRVSRRSSSSYELCALTEGGEETTTLVAELEAPQQALYLEQQFERRLRIADRPIKGELKRLPR